MRHIGMRVVTLIIAIATLCAAVPKEARAWEYCYGGSGDCQCYARAVGLAFEGPYDYYASYPSGGSIIVSRMNDTTYGDCEDEYETIGDSFGSRWISISTCSVYPSSDYAAEQHWWYWESNFQDEVGYPLTWYNGVGLPWGCCTDLGVCNG